MHQTFARLLLTLTLLAVTLGLTPAAYAQPGGEPRVTVTATPQRSIAHPGDQFAIAVQFEFAPHMHIWPNKPEVGKELQGVEPIPTTISLRENVPLPAGIKLYPKSAQWPAPQSVKVAYSGSPITIKSYEQPTTVFLPIVIDPSAPPGTYKLPLLIKYQACNDMVCFQPEDLDLDVPFTIAPPTTPIKLADSAALFKDFDAAVFGKLIEGNALADRDFDFLGYKFQVAQNAYALIFLIAFAAGVLMNFTPCVLPVIPIKVLSIQAHAKSPTKLLSFGIVYCLGIIALYGLLGLLFFGLITGGKRFDWGQIFTIWWFVTGMSLIVGVMGLGMLGLFTLRLPNFVYAVNPTGDTLLGNFVGGLLTGVLAVPCTGPMLGATTAWILTQPPAIGLLTFLVMGLGMAAPYAILMLFPKLVDKMPRGGPGSDLLKQVIGGFMIAVALFLAANLTSDRWPWWIIGTASAATCLWWLIGALRRIKSPTAKSLNALFAALVLIATGYITWSLVKPPPVEWQTFKNQTDAEIQKAIKEAVAKGQVVVIDFTAKWCTNCHVIEKTILYSEEGLKSLNAPTVSPFKVDLTSADSDRGWGTVKEISGGGGIPLIAIYGPALDKPIFFQSFFKPSDLTAAVATARGR